MSYTWNDCQKAIARIYNSDRKVQGTGFLVSSLYLLTCAHVVIDALRLNTETENVSQIPKGTFPIDFPNSDVSVPLSRTGKVIFWNPCPSFFDNRSLDRASFGEDIALVELDKVILESEIKPIILLPIEDFADKPKFDTCGFPQGNDNGELTEGKILGQVRIWLQLQGLHDTIPIRFGYSGSPIFSQTNQGTGIVGMTVASEYYSGSQDLGKNKAYAIPAKALAEVWLMQGQLIEYLNPCDYSWIKRAYNHCRPQDWNSKQPEDLVEVVTDLYEYWEKHKNKENTLINFVVYLIAQPDVSETLKEKLRQWALRAFNVNRQEIAEKCDLLKESLTAKPVPGDKSIESRLWIILNQAGTSDQYKLESAYYIKDINHYKRDKKDSYEKIEVESQDNIKRSQLQDKNFSFPELTEIIEQIYVDKSLRVEFFLPFQSLDLMADSWLIEDEYEEKPFPIGSEYPVVIRVLERHNKIYKKASLWFGNWKPQYIFQLSKQALICSDLPPEKISEELDKEEVLGVHCTCPIEAHHHKPLPMIMRRGLPIALWLRQELKNCCGGEKYQELLDINLVELPQKLKNIRNADRQNESHLAHHISLLWDEPTKLLPSDDYNFQMPKSKS